MACAAVLMLSSARTVDDAIGACDTKCGGVGLDSAGSHGDFVGNIALL